VNRKLATSLSIGLIVALMATGSAQAGGWELPNLNPFAKKQASPSTRPSSGWKMPSLWPSSSNTASRAPSGPSTWQRMTSGTSAAMSKTASYLNPFGSRSTTTTAASPSPSGYGSPFSSTPVKGTAKESKPAATSWLWGDSEPKKDTRPRTVNEFLSQPKPEF
jgi:hypothetical protein